jgi:acetyl esterase/lipase
MKRATIGALLVLVALASAAEAAKPAKWHREEDIIYGRKFGTALTMDVFTPEKQNGAAVIVCISGGWVSNHDQIQPAFALTLLNRGYTVFAVVHGSQPKFTIPECVEDVNRAVRYIRTHEDDFKIDGDKIGITGASAGGHLSLMLGCAGCEGNPDAKDPVDRASSCVQAVACFFPPTDFLNYGEAGVKSLGIEPEHKFKAPFDFRVYDAKTKTFLPVDMETREKIAKEVSPIYHVNEGDAPALIMHGDADDLVPLQQSEIIVEKFKEAGVPAELVVKKGAGHGVWPSMMIKDFGAFADWFDKHLLEQDAKPEEAKPADDKPAEQVAK